VGHLARGDQDRYRFANFDVVLSKPSDLPVTVTYSTTPLSASSADFVATTGLLTFAPGDTRETVGWLLTYTYNLLAAQRGGAGGSFAHVWSLNVEEQFYLVWPWLVLFLPRRIVPIAIGTAVLFAPILRLHTFEDAGIAGFLLAPSSLDMLGIGGLLALAYEHASSPQQVTRYLRRVVLPVGVALLALAAFRPGGLSWQAANVVSGFGAALTFSWLIGTAGQGFGGLFGRALEWIPLRYLGKISYGMYVYHLFVPGLMAYLAWAGGIYYWSTGLEAFVVYTSLTIAIASLSWRVLERPLNNLKRWFPFESVVTDPRPGLPATEANQSTVTGFAR